MSSQIEVLKPRGREEWLRFRKRDITASAVGALFGEAEYTSLFELWALKTGRLREPDRMNDAMLRGTVLEKAAVEYLRITRPEWTIEHNAEENIYFRDPVSRLGATPDVIAHAPGRGRGVIQIKSVEASIYRDKWLDDDGEPEPPFWIALQATLEAHLAGGAWAAVAPFVVGHGIEMPLIEIPLTHKAGVISAMEEKAAEFWRLVETGVEPEPDYSHDAAVIEALYEVGDPVEEIDLTTDNRIATLIEERAAAIETKRQADAALKAAEAEIKSKMGSAEIAHIGFGQRITWKTHRRAAFHSPASIYRALRVPKISNS